MLSSKKTTKAFFGKYVYKIAVRLSVAIYFRGGKLDVTKLQIGILDARIASNNSRPILLGGWRNITASLDDLYVANELIAILEDIEQYTIRVEGDTIGVYCNDADILSKISNITNIYVEEVSEPVDDKTKDFLLASPKAIIRKEYTHKYKVTIAGLWDAADNFKAWAVKLPKIKTTNNKYKYGGFFYVADEKTLSLCHIFLADKIRKIEELVTGSEI